MARYTGPKTKKSRAFGEAIYGLDKNFDKRKYAPGQHGLTRKKKQKSDYANQLMEKQKAKYTYGVLERQFRRTFEAATRRHGVTGQELMKLLESRLDNVVYRLGLARGRRASRQMVNHKHIAVNGIVNNCPSTMIRPGDVISVRGKSQNLEMVKDAVSSNSKEAKKFPWLQWNPDKLEGIYLAYPERDQIPENINEQLIVELYSK
jgi:small subunit ribosomal protein S4